MAINATTTKVNLLGSIATLFYISKFLGILPFDLLSFYRHKLLTLSTISFFYSLATVTIFTFEYHIIVREMYLIGSNSDVGTLTMMIGVFIIYMEPLMMVVDVLGILTRARSLKRCIERLQVIDDKLLKEHVVIDYTVTRWMALFLIGFVTIGEIVINILTNILDFEYSNFWWCLSIFPIYVSSVSKIWFLILVFNIQQKFVAINASLESLQLILRTNKPTVKVSGNAHGTQSWRGRNEDSVTVEHVGYLHKEITAKPPSRGLITPSMDGLKHTVRVVKPAGSSVTPPKGMAALYLNEFVTHSRQRKSFIVEDKLDRKLTTLCSLHNEICEIGKAINRMFSFQMLILMAFGFMAITAQLYFVYCGLVGQTIPTVFRSAESLLPSGAYLSYIAAKCVYVVYISWQTKIAAHRTGVQMHKVANVVDEDHFYQTVNHLSLKLLNHRFNFTACGFFDMDMTTVYAITGAITSYLIILIQFNVAAQRARKPTDNSTITTTAMATTMRAY